MRRGKVKLNFRWSAWPLMAIYQWSALTKAKWVPAGALDPGSECNWEKRLPLWRYMEANMPKVWLHTVSISLAIPETNVSYSICSCAFGVRTTCGWEEMCKGSFHSLFFWVKVTIFISILDFKASFMHSIILYILRGWYRLIHQLWTNKKSHKTCPLKYFDASRISSVP